MNKIKVNDEVVILKGKDAGKQGKVLSVLSKSGKVLVEGLNTYKRATKQNGESQPGGFITKSLPISRSNIALFSKSKNAASKVGIKLEAGKSIRFLKKCGSKLA